MSQKITMFSLVQLVCNIFGVQLATVMYSLSTDFDCQQ